MAAIAVNTAVGGQQDGEKDMVGNGNLGLVLYSDSGGIASTVFLVGEGGNSLGVVTAAVDDAVEVEVRGAGGGVLVEGGVLCHQPVVVVDVGLRLD